MSDRIGGPTQVAIVPTVSAGRPLMKMFGELPGGITGPPTWGTGPVVMGQVCMSVMRAAGGISLCYLNGGCKP